MFLAAEILAVKAIVGRCGNSCSTLGLTGAGVPVQLEAFLESEFVRPRRGAPGMLACSVAPQRRRSRGVGLSALLLCILQTTGERS
jgi:hypothetical protein